MKPKLFQGLTSTSAFAAVSFALAATVLAHCPPQWTTPPPPCEEECGCPLGNNGGGPSGNGGSSPGSGPGDCTKCVSVSGGDGMPFWKVNEAQVDYSLHDTPLRYKPAYGPEIALDLIYRTWRPTDFGYYPSTDDNPLFGTQWHCLWNSGLIIEEGQAWGTRTYWNYLGGRVIFDFPPSSDTSNPTYEGSARMEILRDGGNNIIGGKVLRKDGSVLTYSQLSSGTRFLITSFALPDDTELTFDYDGYGRLDEITTATAETVTFVYGDLNGDSDSSNDFIVTEIHAPGSRTVTLQYEEHDARWYLTNITDCAGIDSAFTYSYNDIAFPYWFLNSMTTPYGTTQFEYLGSGTAWISGDAMTIYGRTLLITQPDSSQHLYLQADTDFGETPPVPSSFDSAVIPTGLPLSTLDTNRQDRNTFYWGPVQLAAIGNLDIDNWDWDQFKLARIRHWLKEYDLWDTGHDHISPTLSWEQSPSPDGTTEGQITWYDYVGKTDAAFIGTNRMHNIMARVMPDGTTWYQYFQRNTLENPTNIIEKWVSGGTPFYRTNKYLYAANGIDLLAHTNAAGVLASSNVFNAYHQVTTNYDALNQPTFFTYNPATHLLTSISRPTGLVTTNLYDGNNRLEKTIDLQINRTNSYTWYSDGNLQTHTDERDLTVTNYWDALNRLTGRKFPDGTTTSNLYVRGSAKLIDVTATKDRMEHWTYFDYDPLRRKIAETNANSIVTRYGYCECGSIATVTNAWGTAIEQATTFNYDYQGNLLSTIYADGYSVTNWYNALGKRTATGDGWGLNWFGYDYDNLGLLTSVTNGLGAEERFIVYDIEDQPIYVTDANGVTITNTYDDLGRLQTRGYPDGGVERFGYSARGLIAYTNQLNFVTRYVYDEARRKLFETNANLEVIRYTNNAAGDLLSLTDGKAQTTRWNYDLYGRVTNKLDQTGTEILRYKYDADNRLTNRWSAAKGETKYTYDNVGNLTFVNYPSSPDITFSYDALNRMTNMVDAVGTTKFTYTAGNQLLTEDGPFANDTVTNTYVNRLRTRLDLQQPTGVWTNGFGYDAAKRLTNVVSPAGNFAYTYASDASRLTRKIALPNTAYITNIHDNVARLTGTYLKSSTNVVLNSHEYSYNTGNQRTQQVFSLGSTYNYTYDNIGQLKFADSGTASEDRGYLYDAAWNLSQRTNNMTMQAFYLDGKNQVTNTPVGNATYDGNGNMVLWHVNSFEFWSYEYDGENQLIDASYWQSSVGFDEGLLADTYPLFRSSFRYDGMGRLRKVTEYEGDGFTAGDEWIELYSTIYVYDGRRVIQDRSGDDDTPWVSYTRGSDLSGSLEGAGGIGGLLGRTAHSGNGGTNLSHAFYQADGSGNITYMVHTNQTMAAFYRYDPFGKLFGYMGSLAAANTYRFSSKEITSAGYYYGYRFYDPYVQRWLNRDPLTEQGHELIRTSDDSERIEDYELFEILESLDSLEHSDLNVYAFVGNDPVTSLDSWGLKKVKPCNASQRQSCIRKCKAAGELMLSCNVITVTFKVRGIPIPISRTVCLCADPKECQPLPPPPKMPNE